MSTHHHSRKPSDINYDNTLSGSLIANIPGSLGYYPTDSVVLLGVDTVNHDHRSVCLGPVARFDIGEDVDEFAAALDEAFSVVSSFTDFIIAVVITDRGEFHAWEVSEKLADYRSYRNWGINVCYSLPEIVMGQEFIRRFSLGEECEECSVLWGSGVVPNIMSTAAMRPWLDKGRLPEPSREDLLDVFIEADPRMPAAEAKAWGKVAYACASELADAARGLTTAPTRRSGRTADGQAGENNAAGKRALVCRPHEFLKDVDRLLADLAAGHEDIDDPVVLATVAMWLSHTMLRDVVLLRLVKFTAKHSTELLTAVAQTFSGDIRANALCLIAAHHVRDGFPMLAGPLLDMAANENPDHSLSSLLARAYRMGLSDNIMNNLERGNKTALRKWRQTLKARGRQMVRV